MDRILKPIVIILVLFLGFVALIGSYRVISIYDEYVALKLQAESINKEVNRYKNLYELSESGCQEKIDKAVKREKDLQDAKDKLNNPDGGIVTLPIRVRD